MVVAKSDLIVFKEVVKEFVVIIIELILPLKLVINVETLLFKLLQLLYSILQDDDKVETEPAIVLCDVLSELTELMIFVDKVDILPLKFVISDETEVFNELQLLYSILQEDESVETEPAIVL